MPTLQFTNESCSYILISVLLQTSVKYRYYQALNLSSCKMSKSGDTSRTQDGYLFFLRKQEQEISLWLLRIEI